MNINYCKWCQRLNRKGKLVTDLDFSIVDDDFGQYIHPKMIKYCPFCGRKIIEEHNTLICDEIKKGEKYE